MKEKSKSKDAVQQASHPSCNFCGRKFKTLPFKCKFCEQDFCDSHRLPEDHSCLGLAARKEQIKSRLQRGGKISYEPQVRKEIKMKFDDSPGGFTAEPSLDLKRMTDPLVKSPLAIIGLVVAVAVIIAMIILSFK